MQQPLYGLIGGKLGHSYSKIIHEKIADYTYELLPLPTEAEARTFMEKRAFAAINVTIPYKQFVIPYCDVVDPKAQAIGAVNTIVNRDGKLYGYNTDYAGFAYLAGAHGVDFAGKTVLILGTGGTHSTVTAVCRDGGAKEILTASRTGKGDALLYSEAMHRPDVQIIVNTTPCGMFPNVGQCLIDPKAFPALEAVLDVVYNPFRTELLLRAEDCGVTAAGGFEMLVAQAVFAAEHFTGRQLDTAAIIPAVSRELRHQLANVSIIGMPGCGKSTVGAALAKRLDKKFVDLDAEIERRTGHNIPDIFAQEGEAAFRRYETDVLAEVAKGNSQVIACAFIKSINIVIDGNKPHAIGRKDTAHIAASLNILSTKTGKVFDNDAVGPLFPDRPHNCLKTGPLIICSGKAVILLFIHQKDLRVAG